MSRARSLVLIAIAAGALLLATASAANGDDPVGLSTDLSELATRDLRSASPAEQAEALGLPKSGSGSLLRDGGAIVVDLVIEAPVRSKLDGIEAAGGRVTAVSASDGMVTASVPEDAIRDVAAAPGVVSTNEVLTPMVGAAADAGEPSTGAINACAPGVISEGDAQLRSALARTQFDVDGTGIKVGVLSDSYDTRTTGLNAADDVASGDLPGPGNPCGRTTPVQVLDDSAGARTDEGRAMLQIVHDVAPGAELAFATAFNSDVSFANNIQALADQGADVIVDDVLYLDEPFYQDGVIANAISDVTEDGVVYYSMAFNNNRVIGGNDSNSWEAPAYRVTGCPSIPTIAAAGDCMNFNPSGAADNTFNITATGGIEFDFVMQWAEPRNGVATNLDLFVVNTATNTLEDSSTNPNSTGKAYERVTFTPTNPALNNYRLIIRRTSGSGTPRLKWVNSDNGAAAIAGLEYPTSSAGDIIGPTIYGHNGTAAAQTVGAVPYNNSSTMEAFSSRGPVVRLFAPVSGSTAALPIAPQVLNKPDVSATDRGRNTFFGGGCPSTCRFSGTSAAAPHAAAVAALQLSANPALTLAQVKATQKATATPVGVFPALAQGAGLVNAQAAIAANPTAAPTLALGTLPPALSNVERPTFTFTTTGRLRSVTCTIDTIVYSCSSPFTAPAKLDDGSHSITINAADYFDQVATSQPATFEIDTTGPKVKVSKGPKSSTTKKKAKFKFSAKGAVGFECKLDGEKFKKCKSPAKFKVKPGKHKLQIQATDSLGNAGEKKAYGWKYKKGKRR